jgi:hypothetical protein
MKNMTKKWYVIRTRPQYEYIAANSLHTNDLEYYLPLALVPDEKLGGRKTPVFPGYMFLRHDTEQGEWPSLSHLMIFHRVSEL